MSWRDYSTAPAPGTPICAAIEVTGVHPVTVSTEKGEFPLLMVKDEGGYLAYVNACPHQYLPLNYRGDQMLSADGTMLLCTGHGARFDLRTGRAIKGADCGLDPVPVSLENGMLVIGG
ncbi:Rieske 2Fe-2S domain-containing protein [Paracoccus sp. R12_1]|uniref:Rieske (2Fe-2S) protein n=1 Tax=unclassified Paracoccus (in: a-proteobacteria) TaxID=2688777 RepID=UPI000C0A7599|nr:MULTISPECIES: Rieske 2Fe-2S domain-containing protein [unclassified Paracoccus (in: a-proteobacteria)]MBO9454490.1 Rieske 2Fe-2S domain-containing protein [Paracoccus sp. R12_2]MBO9486044.1 Rieske 2Fe-2S domain-containing protein [Paracoccus sp. R12_1]PHQ71929.1 MAG: (2Fe-2S)-binding protein [Paracoccus sp. (in: a-proteobacteria)]